MKLKRLKIGKIVSTYRARSKPLVLMLVSLGLSILAFQNCAEDPDLAHEPASVITPQVQNPLVSAFRQQTAAMQILDWGD